MSVNLSIKGVPDEWAERLRLRAERNHRSLQGELMAIVAQAAASEDAPSRTPVRAGPAGAAAGAGAGAVTRGWKSVEQLVAERRQQGWAPHPSAVQVPAAVDIVRADRDSR